MRCSVQSSSDTLCHTQTHWEGPNPNPTEVSGKSLFPLTAVAVVGIAACAACPASLQMGGVGWATPPFTCMPQMGLLSEEARAQAGLAEQIAGISFAKTLIHGAVNIYSVDLPGSEEGKRAMVSTWASCCARLLQSARRGATSVTQGVSPLCSTERKALLPASEWGFYATQQDLPSNRPFLFQLTVSHTEEHGQFVFAATIPISVGIILRH